MKITLIILTILLTSCLKQSPPYQGIDVCIWYVPENKDIPGWYYYEVEYYGVRSGRQVFGNLWMKPGADPSKLVELVNGR